MEALEFVHSGFDDMTIDKINEIQKSLSVGYNYSTVDQTGFGATRVESLETTMKMAVAQESSIRFFKALGKKPATSTIEEYTKMNELGSANFFTEGGSPEEYDEDISREFEKVKYIGALGKIPFVATMVKSIVDNEAMIIKAKTVAILKELNYKSLFGNSDFASAEFNGILKQFEDRVRYKTQNVIDLGGKHLTPEVIGQGALVIQENYGDPMNLKLWGSPGSFQDYAKGLIRTKTFMVGNNNVNSLAVVPRDFELGEGKGRFEDDIFLKSRGAHYHERLHPKMNKEMDTFVATSPKAPAKLNSSTATATAGADTTSKLPAGTYDYAITARNNYGVSAAYEIKNVVVTANQKVTFTLSDNNSISGQEALSFEIYRKPASNTSPQAYRYLNTFKTGSTIVDNGEYIPGTTTAFLFDWDFEQVLAYKELLPMVKMPLAQIDDSKRWMQKHYGTPIVYNPNKIVVFKNVGSDLWS